MGKMSIRERKKVAPRVMVQRAFHGWLKQRRLLVALSCTLSVSAGSVGNFRSGPTHANSASLRLAVGTSTDLLHATSALLAHFSEIAVNRIPEPAISVSGLRQFAGDRNLHSVTTVRDPARFLLSSPIARNFLDSGDSTGTVDSFITKNDLQHALKTIGRGHYESQLLGAAGGGSGRDRIIGKLEYRAALRDPGVPLDIRSNILRELSDVKLARIVGLPDLRGDATDRADETKSFLVLVRASWLGAAEAEALAFYRVPFVMDRGAQDRGYSYWDDKAMHISEKMTKSAAPGYISEVLAHEGGHAVFEKSGLKARVFQHVDEQHLTPGIGNIVNEAFAGVFGNRAHVALFGYNDGNINRHLTLMNDVDDNIANDSTYYAKRYRVNTAAARAQIGKIAQIVNEDLIPFLRKNYGLLGDPLLTTGLESAGL
jgi:hypothetical protein